MANPYKKKDKTTDPKAGKTVRTTSKKWWGKYRDASGMIRRVSLATDKGVAQMMLNEKVRQVEREKAGLVDPTDEQRKRPLSQHLTEFKRYLQNKGVTPKQVHTAINQIQSIVGRNKWKLIGDISASGTLEVVGELRRSGKSAQTSNHYLKSIKQFTRWLVRDRRAPADPLAHLSKLNVSTDRRHDRRALTIEEFGRLIAAAESGPFPGVRPGARGHGAEDPQDDAAGPGGCPDRMAGGGQDPWGPIPPSTSTTRRPPSHRCRPLRPAGRRRGARPPSFGLRERRAGPKSIKWCPLWCPRVPKLVPNTPHRIRCRLHRIALIPATIPTKTATARLPQVPIQAGYIASVG